LGGRQPPLAPFHGRHLPRPLRKGRYVCARGGPWLMPGVVLSEAGGFPHTNGEYPPRKETPCQHTHGRDRGKPPRARKHELCDR